MTTTINTANATTTTATVFTDTNALIKDMLDNYQSFTHNITTNGAEITIPFRHIEVKNNEICLYGNKHFNGAQMYINGKFYFAEKVGAENDLSEYRITTKDNNELYTHIFTAVKKYR